MKGELRGASFDEKMRLARIVLETVRAHPLTFMQLEKRTLALAQCGTSHTFMYILKYLKSQGFIEKVGEERTAPYRITAKGLKFLEAWKDEQHT